MAAFLSKKREIFLTQLSIDAKQAEVAKLQSGSAQRDAALYKGEKMLEEDAARLEEFLLENQEKLLEAVSRADSEARAKQEKARSGSFKQCHPLQALRVALHLHDTANIHTC